MRIAKLSLIFLLTLPLAEMPARSASSPVASPLGMIVQADRALVGADLTVNGATIYDGDRLETNADGTLRARLGGPELYLRPSTSTLVHGLANGYTANLNGGTVVASSAQGQAFQIIADGVTIQPAAVAEPTVAAVSWLSANQLILTTTRGAIKVSMGEESKVLEAGTSYRMEVAPDPAESADPNPQGPLHGGRNRLLFFILIGAGVATSIGIWRALESPN